MNNITGDTGYPKGTKDPSIDRGGFASCAGVHNAWRSSEFKTYPGSGGGAANIYKIMDPGDYPQNGGMYRCNGGRLIKCNETIQCISYGASVPDSDDNVPNGGSALPTYGGGGYSIFKRLGVRDGSRPYSHRDDRDIETEGIGGASGIVIIDVMYRS